MNKPEFLNELNDSQRMAVEHIDGPSLVIAGAGSGKTRVLTYKIAYLLTQGFKPWEIMALTFTNKAAREMKDRVARLVGGDNAQYLKMGTFHSVFASLLRREANKIGYDSNFTIYDDADSRSLCKNIIKEMKLDDKIYKPAEVMKRISAAKNRLILAQDYAMNRIALQRDADAKMPAIYNIYKEYSRRCQMCNAMDFDDLLTNTYVLLNNNADVLKKYATGFKFFLVDEYQDTNHAQQKIMELLASKHNLICAVGDDAQSIYGFRGADIENILEFQNIFRGTRLFKLEQNYRSTQSIVEAANSLIHKNERQIHKNVYSRNAKGSNIELTGLSSDREEALFICKDIKNRIKREGMTYSDFAILYRTNYQSRTFEEQFMKSAMPYRIYGGLSFYQRKEIKDIVAYFRLIANQYDEEAMMRIINYPTRGIGNTTIQKVIDTARAEGCTMWEVLSQPERYTVNVSKSTLNKLNAFIMLITSFNERLATDDAFTLGTEVIKTSGISQDIYSSTDPEYVSRQENVEEFLSSIQEFVESQREQGEPTTLTAFLNDVALLSDRDDDKDDTPKITLMTIHSAKGLEFPCVYVVGMEENIFPSPMCTDSAKQLEEERRLLYVAITRAEKHCHLTFAKMRYRYGKQEWDAPSRFLKDIDASLIQFNSMGGEESFGSTGRSSYGNRTNRTSLFGSAPEYAMRNRKPAQTVSRVSTPPLSSGSKPMTRIASTPRTAQAGSQSTSATSAGNLSIGDKVIHARFGAGTITMFEGSGDSTKATVEFINAGTKKLLLKFANLQKV